MPVVQSFVPDLLIRLTSSGSSSNGGAVDRAAHQSGSDTAGSRHDEVDEPSLLSLPSALLLLDVSGFTALAKHFGSRGVSGLEQLTGVLNAYFTELLAIIRLHRGDLLKVAGDALLVALYDP